MNNVYVLSGYFAEAAIGPLHTGHKEYIQSVIDLSKEGDIIIVIVNNDKQRSKKYSNKTIGSQYSTNLIVEEIKKTFPNVYVKVSISDDKTVRDDLEKIRWFYDGRKYEITFVKDGGEYTPDNLPELSVDYINFLFLENKKKGSASDIIADWENSKENK